MRCKKCGERLKKNEKFCTVCGYYNGEVENNDWNNEEVDLIKDEYSSDEDSDYEDDDILSQKIKEYDEDNDDDDEEEEYIEEDYDEDKNIKDKDDEVKKEEVKNDEDGIEEDDIEEEYIDVIDDNDNIEIEDENTFEDENEYDEEYDEEDYEKNGFLEAYIGEDYNLIKKGIFNIFAFIFSWIYFLYRKMYLSGIIGLLLTTFVVIFFKKQLPIFIILSMIIIGFIFNKYYIVTAKKKIYNILRIYEGSDNKSLKEILRKKGGVSFLPALIIYAFFLILIIISYLKIGPREEVNPKFFKENSENQANCISMIKTAYNNSKEKLEVGSIKEATCRVLKTTPKQYEIYLKTTKNSNTIYTYYKVEDTFLHYKNNTSELSKLEKKNDLTSEETKLMRELKELETNYKSISDKAKLEDQLIAKEENQSEKLNYVFTNDEIIR